MLLRSRPSMTLSFASSRSSMATTGLLRRAARSAASFTTLDSSPPDNPGVPLAMRSRVTLATRGMPAKHARRSEPRGHHDEGGARQREERPPRLARDRLGEQRLPRSRRTDQQRPLGEPPAQPLELLRVLEEIDDLLELLLRLVGAGHIGERDLGSVSRQELRFRLAERERAVSPLLHLPHHDNH